MNHSCTASEDKILEVIIPLGEYQLKFEPRDFGSEFEEKARKELRETSEIIENGIRELKRLILKEPALRFPSDNDDSLKIFLRPCKFYPESAFQKMRRYYKFRLKHPKYFENLLPSRETIAFYQSLLTILPFRNTNGERVLIIEAGEKWDTKTCSLTDLVRAVILLLEVALVEPRTQVAGAHVIVDLEGLSLNHVWQFTPSFAKDIVGFVQDCIPIRLKGVHIVKQPYVFNMLFAIFKPFLSEKLRSRVHFHGTNFESLHSYLDKNIVPVKYDGEINLPMDQGEKLQKYLTRFESEFNAKLHEGYVNRKK